jgi:hypothetical protein
MKSSSLENRLLLFSGAKITGREAYHSPPFSADVNNNGAITPLSYASSLRGTYLVKHKDRFTFNLPITPWF